MRGRQWNRLAMATLAAVAVSACGGGDAGEDTMNEDAAPPAEQPTAEQPTAGPTAANLPEGVTQEQFDEGRQLFTGQGGCVACHGPEATGTQLGPDLTDGEWLNISGRNYDEIVQLINTGVPEPVEHPGPMPPLGGATLSEQQVQALAAYVSGIGQG